MRNWTTHNSYWSFQFNTKNSKTIGSSVLKMYCYCIIFLNLWLFRCKMEPTRKIFTTTDIVYTTFEIWLCIISFWQFHGHLLIIIFSNSDIKQDIFFSINTFQLIFFTFLKLRQHCWFWYFNYEKPYMELAWKWKNI